MTSKKRDYSGFFRAEVTETNIEDNKYGAIRVFVPDIFERKVYKDTDKSGGYDEKNNFGILAYPANNPIGGYNSDSGSSCHYQSSMMVPLKGDWMWVFFEHGHLDRCFYFAAFQFRQAEVPPENKGLQDSARCYTLMKSKSGRSIVVCDSEDQERIEICGKKRNMSNGPSGDKGSVYSIDGNQSSILFDERNGSEKILIRSRKGDYIHFDINERKLQLSFDSDINIETKGNMNLTIKGNLAVKVEGNTSLDLKGNENKKVSGNSVEQTGSMKSIKVGGSMAVDTLMLSQNSGMSIPATIIIPELPEGTRST